MRAHLVPFGHGAFDVVYAGAGDAVANGEERRLGPILFENVENLLGILLPGTVVECERNDLVVADIGFHLAADDVRRLLGDLLGYETR